MNEKIYRNLCLALGGLLIVTSGYIVVTGIVVPHEVIVKAFFHPENTIIPGLLLIIIWLLTKLILKKGEKNEKFLP
ncbi:hypothetical protein [Lactococcus lactis]|uniref:hypothetical protein n=1 Tax=Lactococcus lactis TaxID=1358 RepID=UPI0024A6822D|nr:hypothetical protein [Lactococcus lactis]